MRLRWLQPADADLIEVVEALNAADFDEPMAFTPSSMSNFLVSNDRGYLVAYVDGELAGAVHGFLLWQPSGWKELFVYGVDVVKKHRRYGVAQAMMEEVLRIASDLGAGEVWVGTEADNAPAQGLYRKLGTKHEYGAVIFKYHPKER